jgi:hypothetical protein
MESKGYVVIENALTHEEVSIAKDSYMKWLKSDPQILGKHRAIDPHGIFKFMEVGHQWHAWYIRTRPGVQKAFQDIWKTKDLVVGFDGSCYIPSDLKARDTLWTHTDQCPNTSDFKCVQGMVALTDNEERSLVVYEKSHLMHKIYMDEYKLKGTKNWIKIEADFLKLIESQKRILKVKAGSLILWDSRTFHQNCVGPPGCREERIVQYVCFLPKNNPGNSKKIQEKRLEYFKERRTTSHWPYPIHVNGKQPQTYGDDSRLIEYSTLAKIDLTDLDDEIKKII